MKKRLVFLLAFLLMLTMLPTAQVFAEGEEKEPDYENFEYAILARNPDIHGKHVCFNGFLGLSTEDDGWCLYYDAKDFVCDRKENAVWIKGSLVEMDYDRSIDDAECRELLEMGMCVLITLEGYVNLNNRGPDGKYAATLQTEPVTESCREIISRKDIAGGETQENAIEVSLIRLLGDAWRYQDKWVKISGECSAGGSDWIASFKPLLRQYPYPSLIFSMINVDKDAYMKEYARFYPENSFKEMFVNHQLGVVTITGKIEMPYYFAHRDIMTLSLSKVVDFVLHPLQRKELEEECLEGIK